MNSIIIDKLSQLNNIIETPILLTCNENLHEQETYENMWAISLNSRLSKKITQSEIITFINNLIKEVKIKRAHRINLNDCHINSVQ